MKLDLRYRPDPAGCIDDQNRVDEKRISSFPLRDSLGGSYFFSSFFGLSSAYGN